MSAPARAFLARGFYWAVRRNRRCLPHVLKVLAGAAATIARLRLKGMGRPVLAIGMIEHLGDVMAAEPIARAAREAHPDAWIIWAARAPYAPLVRRFACVDQVVTVTCLSEWMVLARSGAIATVWDLHLRGRYCPHCLIPRPDGLLDRETYLETDSLLSAACRNAGIAPLDDAPHLPVDPVAAERVAVLHLPGDYVVCHAVSNDIARDWRDAHWQTLCAVLRAHGDVALVEIGLRARVITAPAPGQFDLCGRLSILETAEVIRGARLFVGIDSGPAHLANAVGTPGVIIMGKYLTFARYMPFTGPYADGSGADLLRADDVAAAMPPGPVIAAVIRRLEQNQEGQR